MNVIVAVDENWGIGLADDLQFRIRADLRHFRALTLGKTVILGRKTLQTFPNGQPLKDRQNLILSTRPGYEVPGAEVFASLDALLVRCQQIESQSIFVIGGASVYEALLPVCDRAYVTKVKATRPADRYFPDLDCLPGWKLVEASAVQSENDLEFQFLVYEKDNC